MRSRLVRLPVAWVLGIALAGTAACAPTPPPFAGPIETGKLEAPPKRETSGLAFSRRSPGILWTHDDSGGQPVLYAIGENGKRRGAVRIAGTRNNDWEDLAAYELDGKAWLVVGDVGDNDAARTHVLVHVVEEPAAEHLIAGAEITAKPAYSLHIVYEDGARDCESIAVDAGERMLYLLTKRDAVPRLYQVPLAPVAGGRPVIARLAGTVPHVPQPNTLQRAIKGHLGRRRAEVCAMDFAADGTGAVVLTYGAVLYFPRRNGETWAAALGGRPIELAEHGLLQAEAACFTPDGKQIYVASEITPRLIRYERR
jgi:hypothetical protein